MRCLLDTDIVSNLVRDPRGRVAERIEAIGELNCCTGIIVAAGLRFGTMKKEAPHLTAQVDAGLSVIDTLPLDSPADEIYGVIHTKLELAGTPIGSNDLLIAARAIALDLTLVTDNDKEFARIDGLCTENRLRDLLPHKTL